MKRLRSPGAIETARPFFLFSTIFIAARSLSCRRKTAEPCQRRTTGDRPPPEKTGINHAGALGRRRAGNSRRSRASIAVRSPGRQKESRARRRESGRIRLIKGLPERASFHSSVARFPLVVRSRFSRTRRRRRRRAQRPFSCRRTVNYIPLWHVCAAASAF